MDDITMADLRNYLRLRQQIRVLEAEIEAVYVERPAPKEVIPGRSSVRTPSDPTAIKAFKAIKLREKLEEKIDELEMQLNRILKFTLSITDVEVASMIRLHYLEGKTWEQTAMTLYGYPDRWYCYHRVTRYMEARERNDNEETDTGGRIQGAEGE